MDHTPIPTESDPRWQRVLARDAAADGSFVYAVRTTGVYCRPSCPSRRAKPQNVTLYASPDQAEAAGFRPCRRCNPRGASAAEANAALVAAACRLIEQAETPPTLQALAEAAGLSPFHFHRQFKAIIGLTPRAYAAAHRAGRLRARLAQGASVTGAIYEAGFNSSSRFYEGADGMLGMTPSAWRKGGAGAEIRFALGQCALGAILVAQSRRGICAIALGDDPEALLRDFQDRFPAATLIGGDAEFEALVARIVGFIEAPGIGLDLPLDIRGTAFQQRVWQALRQIPPGTTASYAEIARRIGEPQASRAVAQACAANPIAVAIPCHRVVRSDGALSGYRWGVARKRALLDREGAA
ncbi:bifunctional DNA-binding transcriptional regulator/O6-methylguanine-DNA methyltransferase Ada [Paracoccus denitrificans]|jgi:AraC family transcriptional regulator of adaptative response/methylated-DNA-[protein]-cysteine methyltransferase|uniref:methylated-DNA--[protein]-cysteine S-methyltransferase n=1 Tax=Paracoccus denitrificans (strain Pd 1222) TaxID=318586 RepID=A1B9V9_PARDP|nr:bifunctional DNA-binding transcriptional regulator/O6-methylguanine-DNA methyltransferase Ada [Paracoccus denitrificans]ABL72303.1 DNA-O6-methylguanine--protein-cysteine S-methyltransferase [Paracoccus denitrificans PD1222]MBB4629245.1 AraC family transcriptional regulator of adaptative response/methylated-DNA-[protein]-cysteine methyltransferase [Paracoccus denitrificans]MCU7430265.1 bifunctional DNA-binding transcriptional regulator/O6-methylguanine-DNA methyltransferase Ada [Paracoccus den